jgi:hypothetical protein
MHKIPGTPYAPPSSTGSMSPRGAPSFGSGAEFEKDTDVDSRVGGAREAAENTFRVKMEKLSDENSTNLYFEGSVTSFALLRNCEIFILLTDDPQTSVEYRRTCLCLLFLLEVA